MAYIIIQGKKGFVSLVEKGRVKQGDGSNPVCTIRGICGLGNMTKAEFHAFKGWAHSFKDQEERKAMVLLSGRAIATKEKASKEVAESAQKKTTVKRPPRPAKKTISKQSQADREKELQKQEKRVIANMTPTQLKKYNEDIILEKKELQQKFKKLSGIKEDIQQDNKINPHNVSGNVKATISINEQIKENRNKNRILNYQKQLYRDSLKKFGGRW